MPAVKRDVSGGEINMFADEGARLADAAGANGMNITTITIPASKRFRSSRKSRNHRDLPNAGPAPASEATPSSRTSVPPPESQNTEPVPTSQSTAERSSDETPSIEVHIGDEDTRSAPDPTKDWLPYRDICLDELLRHEGLGERSEDELVCEDCGLEPATLKCAESHCVGSPLLCSLCIVRQHARLPLHRIQRWDIERKMFDRFSLCQAGLVVQLGHDGASCRNPRPRDGTLTVIHVSGIHFVKISYCGCARMGHSLVLVQLLRAGWLAATAERPRTVVTLECLKLFRTLYLQGKINAYDFYKSLEIITDGSGLYRPVDRYKEFVRTVRWYRNLINCKYGGRGHDPSGVEGTRQGELVVDCPRCPQPDRNLPKDWELCSDEDRWKYALVLAIDANFKLKLKKKKDSQFELAPGWAYFVEETAYQEWLEGKIDEPDMKYCDSNHTAADHAQGNAPPQRRFRINGVGAVVCSRHNYYRAHGMGDLQKGERHCNMDYILLSTLILTASRLMAIFISYDIACSFSINFFRRLLQFPERLQFDFVDIFLLWAVPKFHLLAHGKKCQGRYSLNFQRGVGRTHGEGVESNWYLTNQFALSTREMTAAGRHEVLNDAASQINWSKTTKIREAMYKDLKTAVQERDNQRVLFAEFHASVPPRFTDEWERLVLEYEDDPTGVNPYAETVTSVTLKDVQEELGREEAEERERGIPSLHETTASVFISMGMDLEEQQSTLKELLSTTATTSHERTQRVTKRNTLAHRIESWRKIQQIYMPGVAALLTTEEEVSSDDGPGCPERWSLWLPSAVPDEVYTRGCTMGLREKECRLRRGQADDALHQIRRQIRVRMGMIHYKANQVYGSGTGQVPTTRAQNLINQLTLKLNRLKSRYRRAFRVLEMLDPHGDWQPQLRQLHDDDVRPPTSHDQLVLGQGFMELSWIWRSSHDGRDVVNGGPDTSSEEVHESMRAEWAIGRARVRRWEEEVELLQLEMKRAVMFFEWKAAWWKERVGARPEARMDIRLGLDSYARQKEGLYRLFALSCRSYWRRALASCGLSDLWPDSAGADAACASATEAGAEVSTTHGVVLDDSNVMDVDSYEELD